MRQKKPGIYKVACLLSDKFGASPKKAPVSGEKIGGTKNRGHVRAEIAWGGNDNILAGFFGAVGLQFSIFS